MDKRDKNKRGIVPVICLLLSIGLWFYVTNVENPRRTYELEDVPVQIYNIETLSNFKLALTPNQEFYVNLKLEGYGSDIYKTKKSDFKIKVDLSDYALKKGENKIPVIIEKSPSDINIKNDNSLTVNVLLEDLAEKTMPISSKISVTTKQGFFAGEPEINPKEVKLSGAESLVNKVSSIIVSGTEHDVSTDISASYKLEPIDSAGNTVTGINLSQELAEVVIKISKGKSVPLKINTVGQLPSGMKLKSLEATRKTVELLGPKEILDKVAEVQSSPLDLSTFNGSGETTLTVVIPEGLHVIQGEEYVNVKISVSKIVSKDFDVTFALNGVSEGVKVTPTKNKVKVTVSGYEDEIENVTIDKIKAELNVEAFKEDGTFSEAPIVTLVGLDKTFTIGAVEKVSFTVVKEMPPKPEGETNQ
ncbi:CdaR family protein [Clostridium chauvoei]|uniref:Membrane associated protein n=2 Tax=Clostridium chauvoei TaxID=46867 RepID=A0ABD4RHQ1_9CLOT|nr:CdaR family protein [Clostridium chauvoei]ATD53990.1 hypothetical protein BTM20_01430 [Clostridium chauvoei]ATD58212.1 hypothetical protein BTM21_10890 [Clostridium chauvoei]MBX7280636.1 hypothetical protein [Clostridium chauvoei]MBX7283036.1 hypothetical protein [Clostridium chauvoei]MBX7285434.1 hypothetical protein [Clostridium chauvoei]